MCYDKEDEKGKKVAAPVGQYSAGGAVSAGPMGAEAGVRAAPQRIRGGCARLFGQPLRGDQQ